MEERNRLLIMLAVSGLVGCGGVAPTTPRLDGGVADLSRLDAAPGLDGAPASLDLSRPSAADLSQATADLGHAAADLAVPVLTVVGADNLLSLDTCGVTPAQIPDLPAGSYTITLQSSTLSKGNVTIDPPVVSVDNYVLVQLPLGAGDAQGDRRFFMLNGIGASASFTLAAPGTVQVMFIDSDVESNAGQAVVSVNPGAYQVTVSAIDNLLRWGPEGCKSNPAMLYVDDRSHAMTLLASTLAWGAGQSGNYVLVRLPSIVPQDDYRYVILNGTGAKQVFQATDSTALRAWFISPGGGASGQATLGFPEP